MNWVPDVPLVDAEVVSDPIALRVRAFGQYDLSAIIDVDEVELVPSSRSVTERSVLFGNETKRKRGRETRGSAEDWVFDNFSCLGGV